MYTDANISKFMMYTYLNPREMFILNALHRYRQTWKHVYSFIISVWLHCMCTDLLMLLLCAYNIRAVYTWHCRHAHCCIQINANRFVI